MPGMVPNRETETTVTIRMHHGARALRQRVGEFESMIDIGPPEWWIEAACRGMGPAIFVPQGKAPDYAKAQRVCRDCTVRVRCFDDAIKREDLFQVAGGTTPRQRRFALHRRMAMGTLRQQVIDGTVPLVYGNPHMRRRRTDSAYCDLANEAVALRQQGGTYREISQLLGVSSLTLSDWFSARRSEVPQRVPSKRWAKKEAS